MACTAAMHIECTLRHKMCIFRHFCAKTVNILKKITNFVG